MKGFNSNFPPKKGGFDLARDLGKVQSEIAKGENVILDTTNMTAQHVQDLRAAVEANGLQGNVIWYP